MVEHVKISEATAQKLGGSFMPEDIYIEQANKYRDSLIAPTKKAPGSRIFGSVPWFVVLP